MTPNSTPPPNYIAGLGRGATGFTTRSDIGPARALPGLGRGRGNSPGQGGDDDDDDDDEYDSEPDSTQCRREPAPNPTITEQFADLKRKLYTISVDEWDSIPDIVGRNTNKKKMRMRQDDQEYHHDLTAVGEGRGTILSLKLDRMSDSVSGLTVVDPKGYFTHLNNTINTITSTNVSDIKKARLLMKSITSTNPKHPPGWIAAARLEEGLGGKIQVARQIIQRGCQECPTSEDVWLEACRLSDEAKAVIARGVKANPRSVKLWLEAAKMEPSDYDKRRVLQMGLENVSDSVTLWKAVVEVSNGDDEARILLRKGVECCPLNVELWLALARLETYDNAKEVLREARIQLPKEVGIWITAAKLEEAKGNVEKVEKVIERGIRSLQEEGVEIVRDAWMKEAEAAERANFVATCRGVIRHTIGIGFEEEDRKRTWVADADECTGRGSIETARAIYSYALADVGLMKKKSVWIKAAQFEKSHGTRESLDGLLRRAVASVPRAETLWLMAAKKKWLVDHDVPGARAILEKAYVAIPHNEDIWLAAFKLEFENQELERAKILLTKARERGGTERVWMKSAIVEREIGNTEEERKLLDEGLKRFPRFFKLWLMLGQLEERLGGGSNNQMEKAAYESGIKNCPKCIPLWLSLANLEEKMNGMSKARAVLTLSRKKCPRNPQLWLAAIRAELRHDGNKREAENLMAKALQECPDSGILWAASIEMALRPQRKKKSLDAYKKCKDDGHVIAAVAKLFWQERKLDKSRSWFNKAVTVSPDIGDFWGMYYKLELHHGTEDSQKDVLKRCVAAEPKHGEKWQAIAKAVENAHKPVEAVLCKVVVALGKEDNAPS